MKKILLTLLLATLQTNFVMQAAQESKMQYEPEPIVPFDEHVDQVVAAFPDMVETFTFLQEQDLVDQSFRQFLQTRLIHDDIENEDEQDVNFGEVIGQAQDVVAENMRDVFIQTLETAIQNRKNLNQFDNPIFIYVMQHKDDSMLDMVKLWLYEWNKIEDEDGDNSLHRAARFNNAEIVRLLIDADINRNLQNKYGRTPLHTAAWYNSKETAHLLIDAGADLNIQDKYDATPLLISAYLNHQEIARILIDAHANVNIQDNNGDTPLYKAICCDYQEIARILIDAGVDLNPQDKGGRTPLYNAARYNRLEIAGMLIDAGANRNLQNKHGDTPLHIAAYLNHPEIARILIDAGANLNIQDNEGWTPLYSVAYRNNLKAARMLIDAGANLNIQDNDGWTAEQRTETPEMRALFAQARQDAENIAILRSQFRVAQLQQQCTVS